MNGWKINVPAPCLLVVVVSGGLWLVNDQQTGGVRNVLIKRNMSIVQEAAEGYAKEHSGLYPRTVDDGFKHYISTAFLEKQRRIQGTNTLGADLAELTNPCTDRPEMPLAGSETGGSATSMRQQQPTVWNLRPGSIEYTALVDADNRVASYAIRASNYQGNCMTGIGGRPFVLSNK